MLFIFRYGSPAADEYGSPQSPPIYIPPSTKKPSYKPQYKPKPKPTYAPPKPTYAPPKPKPTYAPPAPSYKPKPSYNSHKPSYSGGGEKKPLFVLPFEKPTLKPINPTIPKKPKFPKITINPRPLPNLIPGKRKPNERIKTVLTAPGAALRSFFRNEETKKNLVFLSIKVNDGK